MLAGIKRLIGARRAAIAPTVALSLFGLIGIGGIAFDYARLASLDTELQQAADQAALAAATQLDRSTGARARATAAIQNPSSTRLAANITRLANDGNASGLSVDIASITFCKAFDDTVADTTAACTAATSDKDSAFVIVTTQVRTAKYALTPVVAAFSGTAAARAVAGVESAICNVAPLLVCTTSDFPTNADIGRGIRMKVGSGNSWAPGNYGLLDFGNGNTAVINALMGHGLNGCQATDDNETEPGNKNVTDAVNTRMDVYGGGPNTSSPSVCNLANGTGCPAANTRKDMTTIMSYSISQSTQTPEPAVPNCGADATAKNANPELLYESFALNSAAKGFPRDSCHYSDTCGTGGGSNIGDASWERDAYMAANHSGTSTSTVAAAMGKTSDTLTRYDVYKWELLNQASGAMDAQQVGATIPDSQNPKKQGQSWVFKYTKVCNFAKPQFAKGTYPPEKDRRVIPVVAADCTNLKGKGQAFEDYVLLRAFDVFLTEPSMTRGSPTPTDEKEIYGEVIGPAQVFGGTTGFQYYSRNKPYLVR